VVAILSEAMDEFEEYSSMSRQERKMVIVGIKAVFF
jgi:hypothetical protein